MKYCAWLVTLLTLFAAEPSPVKLLQHGGYVIVMCHASSPRETPDKPTANADNANEESELDADQRASVIAMGKALRRLKIPVGEVFTSPAYRVLEIVRLAQFRNPRPQAELGDGGQAAWLRKKVTQFPSGTNTLLITHVPNISGAFPQLEPTPEDGESLVFGPDGKGGATVIARIKIEDWPKMRA